MAEAPRYRAFAVLSVGTTLAVGGPLGLWMLAWKYAGAPAVPAGLVMLHAHGQIIGFFATLIVGVAPHLLARFTGREVAVGPPAAVLAAGLAVALALRLVGTAAEAGLPLLLSAALEVAVLATFTVHVWRVLDPPPLAALRWHLTLASVWLVVACGLEAGLRGQALGDGAWMPALPGLRAAHALAMLGGVIGWVTGVLLRAGPMFVPHWAVPRRMARLSPWLLAAGAWLGAAGEAGGWPALARAGEAVAFLTVVAMVVPGGAFRRAPGSLPLVSRSAEEGRIFRLAAVSAVVGSVGTAAAVAVALTGAPADLLADAARHLTTIGFLTSVVVAMGFRLIVVLERRPLPWPRLRGVAFWALLAGIVGRTLEVGVGLGLPGLWLLVAVSGFCVWLSVACVAVNLAGALRSAGRPS